MVWLVWWIVVFLWIICGCFGLIVIRFVLFLLILIILNCLMINMVMWLVIKCCVRLCSGLVMFCMCRWWCVLGVMNLWFCLMNRFVMILCSIRLKCCMFILYRICVGSWVLFWLVFWLVMLMVWWLSNFFLVCFVWLIWLCVGLRVWIFIGLSLICLLIML